MKPYAEWDDGALFCGDALEVLDAISLNGIDAVITDPPYGISRENHGGFLESRGMVANDDCSDVGQNVLDRCEFMEIPTAAFASPKNPWCGSWRNFIVWDKGGAVAGGGDLETCLKLSWELIQVARNPPLSGGRDTSVWEHRITQQDFENHPTEKPVGLIERLILQLFAPCILILDPFIGSGTTAVACVRTGRKFIGVELEERYCEIAAKRITRELAQPRLPFVEPIKETQAEMFAELEASK